ncbi:MAG: hypothetical protein WB817_13365 [Terriglobales bacterium]
MTKAGRNAARGIIACTRRDEKIIRGLDVEERIRERYSCGT